MGLFLSRLVGLCFLQSGKCRLSVLRNYLNYFIDDFIFLLSLYFLSAIPVICTIYLLDGSSTFENLCFPRFTYLFTFVWLFQITALTYLMTKFSFYLLSAHVYEFLAN